MPTKDGWDVLSELREDPDVADVPVVMLTAQADEATEWRARELGAAAYIAKPVNLEDLLDVVVRVLAISR
jgi:DNA-binding response OmpR family regulator